MVLLMAPGSWLVQATLNTSQRSSGLLSGWALLSFLCHPPPFTLFSATLHTVGVRAIDGQDEAIQMADPTPQQPEIMWMVVHPASGGSEAMLHLQAKLPGIRKCWKAGGHSRQCASGELSCTVNSTTVLQQLLQTLIFHFQSYLP